MEEDASPWALCLYCGHASVEAEGGTDVGDAPGLEEFVGKSVDLAVDVVHDRLQLRRREDVTFYQVSLLEKMIQLQYSVVLAAKV